VNRDSGDRPANPLTSTAGDPRDPDCQRAKVSASNLRFGDGLSGSCLLFLEAREEADLAVFTSRRSEGSLRNPPPTPTRLRLRDHDLRGGPDALGREALPPPHPHRAPMAVAGDDPPHDAKAAFPGPQDFRPHERRRIRALSDFDDRLVRVLHALRAAEGNDDAPKRVPRHGVRSKPRYYRALAGPGFARRTSAGSQPSRSEAFEAGVPARSGVCVPLVLPAKAQEPCWSGVASQPERPDLSREPLPWLGVPTAHVRVHYASDHDLEASSRRMFHDVDPKARRRDVAASALEVNRSPHRRSRSTSSWASAEWSLRSRRSEGPAFGI